jgi:hypothetical protein
MEPITINSVEDLQRAKAQLRVQINNKEQDLKAHYKTISNQVAPALRIANVVSGNRLFKSALGSNNENDNGWLSSAMKIMIAVSAGGFILHQNKKNLGKALLAYALDQGVKYIKGARFVRTHRQVKKMVEFGY